MKKAGRRALVKPRQSSRLEQLRVNARCGGLRLSTAKSATQQTRSRVMHRCIYLFIQQTGATT